MATVNITISAPDLARYESAVGWKTLLGRDATASEAKQYLIDRAISLTKEYETWLAQQAIAVTPIAPT